MLPLTYYRSPPDAYDRTVYYNYSRSPHDVHDRPVPTLCLYAQQPRSGSLEIAHLWRSSLVGKLCNMPTICV
eukprot:g59974.t1